MLKNYFLITIRSLARQKGFAIINIGGLAVGMAAFVLITLFVQNELSYDVHHEHGDDLYRILLDAQVSGQEVLAANSATPLAETMVAEIPSVMKAARVDDFSRILVGYEDQTFYEDHFYLADSTFFELFSYEFVAGDPAAALTRPFTVVIRDEVARRYFRDEDPIGKTITVDQTREYEVTGVYKPVGSLSHLKPDFLGSAVSSERMASGIWLNNSINTYVRLEPGTDPSVVDDALAGIVRKYVGPSIEQVMGVSFDQALEAGLRYNYLLESVPSIYLHSQATEQSGVTGDIKYVYILGAIALFVLLIACVNFINLSTARATGRAREVGLRKVLGSNRTQLIKQFMGESTVVVVISMIIALAIAATVIPWFNRMAGTNLQVGPWLLGAVVLAAIGTGVFAGFYPSVVLSRFRPARVLRGTFARLRIRIIIAKLARRLPVLDLDHPDSRDGGRVQAAVVHARAGSRFQQGPSRGFAHRDVRDG